MPLIVLRLPIDMQIEIAGHLAATLDWPLDDLRILRVTCSSMHHIYGDPAIGRCLALDRFKHGRTGADPIDYYALLASLTHVDNMEACFLIGIQTIFMEKHSTQPCLNDLARVADSGHHLAAYLIALLLYRYNGDARDNDNARST